MKIYIVGTVGSGKSTLARQLGELLSISVFPLDDVVHDGKRRRSEQEISDLTQQILQQEKFIIEDTLREQFTGLLREVDSVIFLDLPEIFLKYRVIKRYFRQKLGLESANYQPSLQMLRQMFIWQKIDRRDLIETQPNLIVLRSKRQIKKFIEEVSNDKNDSWLGKSRR
ncbi:hypothetical protein EQJ87_08315 [Lactococcus kimchii]|nr:hypothetical protein EQJ87_08315 [Lactococcus sp. S-13]